MYVMLRDNDAIPRLRSLKQSKCGGCYWSHWESDIHWRRQGVVQQGNLKEYSVQRSWGRGYLVDSQSLKDLAGSDHGSGHGDDNRMGWGTRLCSTVQGLVKTWAFALWEKVLPPKYMKQMVDMQHFLFKAIMWPLCWEWLDEGKGYELGDWVGHFVIIQRAIAMGYGETCSEFLFKVEKMWFLNRLIWGMRERKESRVSTEFCLSKLEGKYRHAMSWDRWDGAVSGNAQKIENTTEIIRKFI